MTLTEILEIWVKDAERMHGSAASAVVVTRELFTQLLGEQSQESPSVSGVDVFVAASETLTGEGLLPLSEMVEIAGPDRVCIYVGARPRYGEHPVLLSLNGLRVSEARSADIQNLAFEAAPRLTVGQQPEPVAD